MSDIIRLLPDSIANQIAAGEVVQRPASVVKELIENAIDAGATRIQLLVKNAGKSLIQVLDNGCGMSETDARMSFERHATSKIREAKDLFSIRTMGFRGEALASISAVATVVMKTRKASEDMASVIEVRGSEVIEQKYGQSPPGTHISVKNLFYNTPGRRKFLKSDLVELKHIREEFIRIALSYPRLEFTLHSEDKLLYQLNPGSLKQRIISIFGEESGKKLVPIDEDTSSLKISGFIGKPEYAKKSRSDQYLFVNKRFVKNYYVAHAVKTAYQDLMDEKKNPFFVLFLDIDPEQIDINVHPTKHEVKFQDERLVYQIVQVTVKHALGKHHIIPSLDFESDNTFMGGQNQWSSGGNVRVNSNPDNRTSDLPKIQTTDTGRHSSSTPVGRRQNADNILHWKKLYEVLNDQEEPKHGETEEENQVALFSEEGTEKRCIQVQNAYILTAIRSGFVMIDQRAAHERIIFERIKWMKNNDEISSQRLLFPVMLELSSEESLILLEMVDEINHLGFDINEFGKHSFVIHAQPAYSEVQLDVEQIILDLIKQKSEERALTLSVEDELIRKISIHSAIKKGQKLEQEEMKNLIDSLFACEQANYGLRKNKTFRTFSGSEILEWFK